MVTSVSAIAISGETQRDLGRAFGALFKHQLHAPPPFAASADAAAHQQAELLAVGVGASAIGSDRWP